MANSRLDNIGVSSTFTMNKLTTASSANNSVIGKKMLAETLNYNEESQSNSRSYNSSLISYWRKKDNLPYYEESSSLDSLVLMR